LRKPDSGVCEILYDKPLAAGLFFPGFSLSKNFFAKKVILPLGKIEVCSHKLIMKLNSYSAVVRDRLSDLDLSKIPAVACAYIEAKMVKELAKIASRKISTRYVSRAILKAASSGKSASESTENVAKNISPSAKG